MIIEVPQIERVNGKLVEVVKDEIVYDYKTFPIEKFLFAPTCRKRNINYLNIACSFDIETYTVDTRNKSTDIDPWSYMYHWQFCIHDSSQYIVCFGRFWEEFLELLHLLEVKLQLTTKRKLVIYVHNLAYEFQFIKDFIHITKLFAKSKRKPIKVETECFEYRCSYFLSNMSLLKFCENSELCTHYKLKDGYDYEKFRTPYTKMDNNDLAYCYNDVVGLCECIITLMQEDNLATIPLTNTGYVRREYRQACSNSNYRKLFQSLALNEHDYILCRKSFRGGDTHANYKYAYMLLSNVYSMDKQSSYPASMMLDDFPMSPFMQVKIENQWELDYYMERFCMVMDITILNLKSIIDMPYIDIAHCYQHCDITNDNGRVLSAKGVSLCCTNLDLKIIRETYTYDGLVVNDCIISRPGKLPYEIRKKLMHFYELKTILKGVTGKEYEYMKSKNRVNSSYGMMVTDIAHGQVEYNSLTHEWTETKPDIAESLEKYYKGKNNFLCYQWGIFVTANARYNLYQAQKLIGKDDIYKDTDSHKFRNFEHIRELEKLNQEIIKQCENSDIPAYVVKNGKKYYLGVWDFDGYYRRFITLGAKKYAYEDRQKKLHTTVAGMSKKLGAKAVKKIENFKIGKVYHNVGRKVAYYNESLPHMITAPDGSKFLSASNIALVESTYELGVTNEYWELIHENVFSLLTDC